MRRWDIGCQIRRVFSGVGPDVQTEIAAVIVSKRVPTPRIELVSEPLAVALKGNVQRDTTRIPIYGAGSKDSFYFFFRVRPLDAILDRCVRSVSDEKFTGVSFGLRR